jgi:hypothetical protein
VNLQPTDQANIGEGLEPCPECEMPVDRNGVGHGLSRYPGRMRNCSLDHLPPHKWEQPAAVQV